MNSIGIESSCTSHQYTNRERISLAQYEMRHRSLANSVGRISPYAQAGRLAARAGRARKVFLDSQNLSKNAKHPARPSRDTKPAMQSLARWWKVAVRPGPSKPAAKAAPNGANERGEAGSAAQGGGPGNADRYLPPPRQRRVKTKACQD